MQLWFISSLIFAIFIAVFAVSNSDVVTIRFFWKQIQMSQSVVILGSAAIGSIIVAFIGVVSKIKSGFKIRELRKQVQELEEKMGQINVQGNSLEFEKTKNISLQAENMEPQQELDRTQ